MKKGMKKLAVFMLAMGMSLAIISTCSLETTVTASGNSLTPLIKQSMIEDIKNHANDLTGENKLSEEDITRIIKIKDGAITVINSMTTDDGTLTNYIAGVKSEMSNIAAGALGNIAEYLYLTDNVPVSIAGYGRKCNVMLSILNLSDVKIEDLVITPKVSTSVTEWPFEIQTSGYTRVIPDIPGNETYDEAIKNRREITFTFETRDDVYTGVYPVEFEVAFTRGTGRETTILTTYVKGVGAKGSGSLDASTGTANVSKPRIIVNGFTTTPEEVYAGDIFTIDIHIENTSQRTSVSNIKIDLKANPEGDVSNSYEAFLPTSGSNTVYIDKIKEGGTADVSIEMTAKADLAQKPYVLNVEMEYEDDQYNTYTSAASVSVPIKQESKFDVSTPEVMPMDINVGAQSNVMYSIYNTGKTTLYNVQAKFEAPSITGGDVFIGKIEPGATGNVDAMLTGVAPTMDDGTVKAIISYEDEAGNVSTHEEIITVWVMEAFDPYVEGGMEEGGWVEGGWEEGGWEEGGYVEGTGKFPIWIPIVIVVVVLGVAGVVTVLVIKKKKASETDDLVDEIDELEE